MEHEALVNALARSFQAGEQSSAAIMGRCTAMLGVEFRWLARTIRLYLKICSRKTRLRHREVAAFIDLDWAFRCGCSRLNPVHLLTEPQKMEPVAAAASWNLPRLETVADLADWFWLEPAQLEWFADLKGICQRQRLRHYHYRKLNKADGGVRLIEAPKRRLLSLQRQVLEEILNCVPPHPGVHGFVKGRSILTFAAPHVAKKVVVRLDLKDFFPSFRVARIQAVFRTLGYPEAVADLLSGICTNAAPEDVTTNPVYTNRHLPQGAPTSPALANICTYRLDCRLAGLAEAAGGTYTRYADDLAFSGDRESFSLHAAAILLEEGFAVQHRKTRVMRPGVRQHLTGLVANQRLNVRRTDFDRLKAILTNCARFGPDSQNRDDRAMFQAHLNGRIGFVEMVNQDKGRRLRTLFERIRWPGSALL